MSTYNKVASRAANGGKVLRRVGLVVAAVVAVLVVASFSTSSVSTGPNQIAVQIGGGPIEDARFKGCVPAGTHENFNSPGDTYVTYSSSQRDWDATGQEGSDATPFKVVSADNVERPLDDPRLGARGWHAAVCTDARPADMMDPHALALRPFEALVLLPAR